jgi:hypothetical protein
LGALYCRKGLYAGLAPSLVRAVPAAAATFVGFELTRGKFAVVIAIEWADRVESDYILEKDLL